MRSKRGGRSSSTKPTGSNDRRFGRSRKAAERQVASVAKLAKAARVPLVSLVEVVATPYEGIVDAARKNKCDVIFMASHGHRGLSRLMMGSVTQKVLSHATVPVLVFR